MHTSENPLIRVTDNSAYSLHTAVELFLEHCEARGLRAKSITFYAERLRLFTSRVCVPLEQVDAFSIRRYLLQRQREANSTHTVHADYRALRAFFSWCAREELLPRDPMEKVQPPKTDVVCKPPLTEEQIRALLDACRGTDWLRLRDYALVLTLLDTGLRASEVCMMTVADGTSETFLIRGKSRRDRLVCLSAETRLAIRKYLRAYPEPLTPESPLWWGTQGALTVYGVLQAVERIGKRAGLREHLGCHAFRRSFAVYSLRSGMSLEHLRELLGHRDFATLKHYVKLVEQDLKQAHAEHSPLRMLRKR